MEREIQQLLLAMFKHAIGDDSLKVIKTFSYATEENVNDWHVVMSKLEKHCIGEVNEIYERYCFNRRDKLPTESMDNFVAELNTLAKTCNFCECLRDSLICDHIVLELRMNKQRRSYHKQETSPRSEEVTDMQMKSLAEPKDIDQLQSKAKFKPRVFEGKKGLQSGKKVSCKFCGYEHAPDKKKCPAWGKTCNRCKERNHFAKKCKKTSVYSIESEDEYEEISMVKVQAVREKAVFAKMHINNKTIKFQIDCGASANVLPLKFAKDVELTPCTKTLVMWNGTKVKPLGSCTLLVINPKNDVKYQVKFLVVEENWTPLLGLNAVEKMKLLTVHSENFVNVVEKCDNDPVTKYPDVFDENLGTLPGKVHLQVDATCKPVVLPARKIPVAVREKLKNELKRLEDLSHSPCGRTNGMG